MTPREARETALALREQIRRLPTHIYCGCGARQTTVAYSPYYRGLMFGCAKNPGGCRSQDEGSMPTAEDARVALDWNRRECRLRVLSAGSLDPAAAPRARGQS